MLGKLLGLVTAGAFVGAAAVEVLGYLTRHRAGKEPLPPQATDDGIEDSETQSNPAPQAES